MDDFFSLDPDIVLPDGLFGSPEPKLVAPTTPDPQRAYQSTNQGQSTGPVTPPASTDAVAAMAAALTLPAESARPFPLAPPTWLPPPAQTLPHDPTYPSASGGLPVADDPRLPVHGGGLTVADVHLDTRLAFELAQGLEPPVYTCLRYGLDSEQAQRLLAYRPFMLTVKAYRAQIKQEGTSFRVKAKMMSEDTLPDAYVLAKGAHNHPETRLKAVQWLARMAGYDSDGRGPGGPGVGFAVAITMQSAPPQRQGATLTATHTLTPAPIEGQVVAIEPGAPSLSPAPTVTPSTTLAPTPSPSLTDPEGDRTSSNASAFRPALPAFHFTNEDE